MPDKYAIWKCSNEGVWFPHPPAGRWLLCDPNGKAKILPTWDAAIRDMHADIARQIAKKAAVNNRIPLRPIGKVNHASLR